MNYNFFLHKPAHMIYADITETKGLSLGDLPIGNGKHLAEYGIGTLLLEGQRTIDDATDIDVHVVFHLLIGLLVCGDLDHRGKGDTGGGTPAGGESNQLAAACNH